MEQYKNDQDELREALDLEGIDRSEHRERVEGIQKLHSHTIKYIELIDESTCATYAFGLTGNPTYYAIAGNFGRRIYAGKNFMEWLLQEHLVEISKPEPGCLAMYFKDDEWTHVGIYKEPHRVISQWGTFPVYEHGIFEVRNKYGDVVRYYKKPTAEQMLQLFLEYAKLCGVSQAHIEAAKAESNEVRPGMTQPN